MKSKKEFDYFDKPENIRKLWIMLYVTCGLTVLPDLFTHRHAHFGMDSFFSFYALLGFVSCAVLILFSKLIGLILKVKEDYYDR
jgi:multisubunit Na+/H+ antiporter MnhG subunit